jgi:phytoene dehydrogenase-like protein
VLLHHYIGEVDGQYRGWGFQKGGTGQVAETIARAARAHGAEIRTDARVDAVLLDGGRATGVALQSGEELRARAVLSSLAPQTTFLRLLPRSVVPAGLRQQVEQWSSAGCSAKVNLALSGLPRFAWRPDPGPHLAGGISIAPSLDEVERAFDDYKAGSFSRRPFIDLVIPSVLDRDMAPPGQHVMSCFVQYAPYQLAQGSWEEQREALADAAIDVLVEHIPNLRELIVHAQVMSPLDIERVVGIPGGNIFHGELSLAQLFLNRPGVGAASYRTPVPGYYVCGSATHTGGGISGAPGRLGALVCLQDLAAGGAGSRPAETAGDRR